jgi:hypothetical protein
MKQTYSRKDAETAMTLISILFLLELAELGDALHAMSYMEDVVKAPGGAYIGILSSIINR